MPPPRRRRRRRRRAAPGRPRHRSRSRRAERRRPRRRSDPQDRPRQRARRRSIPTRRRTRTSIAVLHALHRGLVYFDKDLKVVPALAKALPEISADAKTLTFTLKDGIKYSNGDPIVAGDFVYSIEAHCSTREPRRRTPTSWPRSRAPTSCSRLARRRSRPRRDADSRRAPRQGRRLGAGRQDRRRQPRPPRRPTSPSVLALWIDGPDPGEVDHQPERDRGRQLRQLRPVHPRRPGTTTARSSSSRTRTGPATSSRP